MKANALNIVLSVSLLAILLWSFKPANESFDKISVREFELVDSSGKQRASIKVEEGGEIVLRLRDAQGNIRVKIGADEDGSGLVLLDSDTNPGVHALAKKKGSTVSVLGADGKEKEY